MNNFQKVKSLVKSYTIFKFQNLCQRILTSNDKEQLREYAKKFDVPEEHWDNPRMICSLITPRINDFLEKKKCDNDDEDTMDGDKVGDIPEYLKYTYIAPNGKVYCSSIVDLYKSLQNGQTQDPYRRFELNKDEIEARYDFLNFMIESHGMSNVFESIKNTIVAPFRSIALPDLKTTRDIITSTWDNLSHPKYTSKEILRAPPEVIKKLFDQIWSSESLNHYITSSDKEQFESYIHEPRKLLPMFAKILERIKQSGSRSDTIALEELTFSI